RDQSPRFNPPRDSPALHEGLAETPSGWRRGVAAPPQRGPARTRSPGRRPLDRAVQQRGQGLALLVGQWGAAARRWRSRGPAAPPRAGSPAAPPRAGCPRRVEGPAGRAGHASAPGPPPTPPPVPVPVRWPEPVGRGEVRRGPWPVWLGWRGDRP